MRALRTFSLLVACLAASFASGGPARAPSGRARTLRVMSYNVHVGIGMDKRLDLRRVAEVIRRERPDLVGLQEIDRGTERTGRVDLVSAGVSRYRRGSSRNWTPPSTGRQTRSRVSRRTGAFVADILVMYLQRRASSPALTPLLSVKPPGRPGFR